MRFAAETFLTDFRTLGARYEMTQAETLDWLASLHARASGGTLDHTSVARRLERFGAASNKVARRTAASSDVTHTNWSEMSLFGLGANGTSLPGTTDRMRVYSPAVAEAFERFYVEETTPPSDLIHVTCTGYEAPSAAQKLVTQRGWNDRTTVTHAYHMGCYAAFPAIRMAAGFAASRRDGASRIDIVHTELCSLHAQPERIDAEQLVIESLFADGFARYSVGREPGNGFRLLALCEEILPDSEADMAWVCSDHGMSMTLSRDVPGRLAACLKPFVSRLIDEAGMAHRRDEIFFAIHPGGPRIIDLVQSTLELGEERLRWSRAVLLNNGNMSSATLPHIWSAMSADREIKHDTLVASLAFGPGLTLCGSVMTRHVS